MSKIILIFLLLQGCVYSQDMNTQSRVDQRNLLCESLCKDSIQLLQLFFERWHNEIAPISSKELMKLSDTVQTIYKMYEDYCDDYFVKYPKSRNNSPYCMFQNEISVSFYKNIHFRIETDAFAPDSSKISEITLDNFRPLPTLAKSKVLYVSPYYNSLLDYYMSDSCNCSNETSNDRELWSKSKRAKYLGKMIKPWMSTNKYHFHTPPYVNLRFNYNMKEVIVEWNIGEAFGSDLFILSKGKWKYKDSSPVINAIIGT